MFSKLSFILLGLVASSACIPAVESDVQRLRNRRQIVCRSDDGACGQPCGGIASIACPRGLICVDDPDDTCNPQLVDADCIGMCAYPEPCGGIAAIPCTRGFICVDKPDDNCDPRRGGSDCIGICVPA